jgi:hypothetical protein
MKSINKTVFSSRQRLFLLLNCLIFLAVYVVIADDRMTLNFDPGWRFIKADPAGAPALGFDEHEWENVALPHTYNDTDTFNNFSRPAHHGEENQWGERTWYRKTFSLPENLKGKKVFIEFQGARQVAEVYLNGHFLGVCKNGFVPFSFDLTPELRFEGPNVLVVMSGTVRQEALGHNSKAMHRAYANRALMKIPSLEEYEKRQAIPARTAERPTSPFPIGTSTDSSVGDGSARFGSGKISPVRSASNKSLTQSKEMIAYQNRHGRGNAGGVGD